MSPHRLRMLLIGLLSVVLLGSPTPAIGGKADEPTDAALAAVAAQANTRPADQFYFVLPDRFANGDPGNDKGGYPGDRMSTGYDPTDKGFYHGGDLKGLIDRLEYIQGMGTTAIWLAPVFKNRPVQA